jgi:16S rRNA processing protein RimM
MGDDHVVVGVVGKPFGLRGEVYVHPDADFGHDFAVGTVYDTDERALTVAGSHVHAGRQLVHFDGVDDRESAEALRGVRLRLPRDAVGLDEEAFWAADVLGREVVDQAGVLLGVVEGFADGPAHDYLVVARPDGGEVMVPAVADLVRIEDDRVVVVPLPGLFDPE